MSLFKSIENLFEISDKNRKQTWAAIVVGSIFGVFVSVSACYNILFGDGCSADVHWAKLLGAGCVALVMLVLMGILSGAIVYGIGDMLSTVSSFISDMKDPDHREWKREEKARLIAREGRLPVRVLKHFKTHYSKYLLVLGLLSSIAITGYLISYIIWLVAC